MPFLEKNDLQFLIKSKANSASIGAVRVDPDELRAVALEYATELGWTPPAAPVLTWCTNCGKGFTTFPGDRKFCTTHCAGVWWDQRQRLATVEPLRPAPSDGKKETP